YGFCHCWGPRSTPTRRSSDLHRRFRLGADLLRRRLRRRRLRVFRLRLLPQHGGRFGLPPPGAPTPAGGTAPGNPLLDSPLLGRRLRRRLVGRLVRHLRLGRFNLGLGWSRLSPGRLLAGTFGPALTPPPPPAPALAGRARRVQGDQREIPAVLLFNLP